MKDDPVIGRIRAARHHISEECKRDPHQLVVYYQKRQSVGRRQQ